MLRLDGLRRGYSGSMAQVPSHWLCFDAQAQAQAALAQQCTGASALLDVSDTNGSGSGSALARYVNAGEKRSAPHISDTHAPRGPSQLVPGLSLSLQSSCAS